MATISAGARSPVTAFVVVVAAAIFLNYVDRGAIGIAAPLMKGELGLSATRFGIAVSAFFWVYAPIQLLIGRMCDRLPVYRVYGAGIALWAASTLLTSFVAGFVSLVALRILLGVGESVAFPGSSKMIARHVPAERRGLANAAVAAALAIGPAAGTLTGGLITANYGWRPMFFCFGLVTFLWLLPWRQVIRQIQPAEQSWATDCVPIGRLTQKFSLWAMGIGHFTNNYSFYFLLTWLPLFLVQQRGFSIEQMSYLAALSYAAQAAAALLVGWISDRWTSAGKPKPSIRRGILVLGQLLLGIAIVGILISRAEPLLWLWLSVAGAGIGLGTVNLYAVAQIFAGQRASGTWVGVQNAIGNLAGIVGPVVTGVFIDLTGSYSDGFWLAAAVAGAGALWWWLFLPPIRQVELE